ncbi:translation elongation factor 4 [Candidatus Parcubacteria bacterium]|nr:translation elongation factor 4 [Candidatus Parcubacteria bacterium]
MEPIKKQIRNFVIISHVDHGKSTLADRFLELTNTVPDNKMQEQFLDMMDLERERGITIKLQPVRMELDTDSLKIKNLKLKIPDSKFILNLVDTPGHVDFSYEVSRALAAVEGAILLVDAAKGVQAQTLANLELAKKQGLAIIPIINKIDLQQARTEETKQELAKLLNISEQDILSISAKKGINIEKVLEAIIAKVKPPEINQDRPLRALIFDSKFDSYKGVIAYVRVIDGQISNDEKIYLMASETESKIKELGYFKPELSPQKKLSAGEIGYIATGIKEPGKVRVGDTITKLKVKSEKLKIVDIEALPGYKEPKPVVFISVYPENSDRYGLLRESLNKLKLNDASLYFEPEHKEIFGQGFRCGFLGSLHLEITVERLHREFDLDLVVFSPSVVYKIIDKVDKEIFVYSSAEWPDLAIIKEIQEPYVKLEIICFSDALGNIMKILDELQGRYIKTEYLGLNKPLLTYHIPLREVITGFYDKLMSVSQGYASMNYEILGYEKSDLVKLEILIIGKKEEAFSRIVPKEKAYPEARTFLKKIKEVLPQQQFSVPLQAVIGGKIIARETISSRGKDVIAPLYGGDYSRKRKLLEKQKKGKKKLKEKAQIKIPSDVYLKVLS